MYTVFFWVVYLGIRVAIAYGARKVAIRKRRDGTAFFIFGLIFPVITIIVAYAISPVRVDTSTTSQCPKCFKPVKLEEQKCASCGHLFSEDQYFEHLAKMVALNDISPSYKALQKLKEIDNPKVIPLLEKMLNQNDPADYPDYYLDDLKIGADEELIKRKARNNQGTV